MARALTNARFYHAELLDIDLKNMDRDTARRFLHSRLRRLDAQIEGLADVQRQAAWRSLERAIWSEPAAAELVWAGRLELHYLHAVREALVETLINL